MKSVPVKADVAANMNQLRTTLKTESQIRQSSNCVAKFGDSFHPDGMPILGAENVHAGEMAEGEYGDAASSEAVVIQMDDDDYDQQLLSDCNYSALIEPIQGSLQDVFSFLGY